jgi:hypothetical protein
MTGWFAPAQLARTGLQSVVSRLFGTYADRREVQACLSAFKIYDYSRSLDEGGAPSPEPDRWIDFVSDLGDGFNPTYAVAYLMGQPELTLDHPGPKPEGPDAPAPLQYRTKRGNILVMGGDQVYPTPGADGYAQRLIGPFRAARSYVDQNPPSVFAIPGNHDWYDGLSAFLKLFCQPGRWIGAWKVQQKRSYFAIKLPYNWWLWGIDIQLGAEIDYPQQQYFEEVAKKAVDDAKAAGEEARIILCTAEPAWVYPSYKHNKQPLKNLEVFCQRYIREPGLKLAATLTGDLHHYASYQGVEDGDWKITAGGGGAFMHPTHQLPQEITIEKVAEDSETLKHYKRTYRHSAFFPTQKESRRLAFRTLGFPFLNLSFTALLAGLFALFARSWHAGTWLSVLLLGLAYFGGVFLFTDRSVKKHIQAKVAGVLHAGLQVALLVGTGLVISRQVTMPEFHWLSIPAWSALGQGLGWSALGGLAGSLLMGLYLIACTLLIGNHETEAFSAFRGQGYKNFLRLHLTRERLTLYPIGLRKVPTRWKYRPNVSAGSPWYEPPAPLRPELIEVPIHIPNDKPDAAPASAISQTERA